MGETRSEWLHLRVTHRQRAAKEDLADRRYFAIDDAAWAEFNALLNRPPVFKPSLERLLAKPTPWRD
jgi:uncharacterized protein (DUF1778 family)